MDVSRRRTMLKHVFYTAIFVDDQHRALDFYTTVVGLEKRNDNPGADGQRFLSVGVKGQEDFMVVLAPGAPGGTMTIEVDDCQAEFNALQARGVTFDPPSILQFPWGSVARFEDPDGNRLQIRQGRTATS
jgi:predicted enzyme related to lactoylglutathione lyase